MTVESVSDMNKYSTQFTAVITRVTLFISIYTPGWNRVTLWDVYNTPYSIVKDRRSKSVMK